MDAFRKQLDALMGADRNGEVGITKKNFSDRDVCRYHLEGMCPHDLFTLTKMDMGPCPRVHSLQLRKEYEEAKQKEGQRFYENEFLEMLERMIMECDRKIVRSLRRLDDEEGGKGGGGEKGGEGKAQGSSAAVKVSEVTKSEEVSGITKMIAEKTREAEELDLQNRMDEKFRLMEEIDALRQKRADQQAHMILDAFNRDRQHFPVQMTILPSFPPSSPALSSASPALSQHQAMISEKLKKAEAMGEEGKVDEAQKLMEEAEALKKLVMRSAPVDQSAAFAYSDQKLRVCDICGAFLSIYDSDKRLADHFGGKLHIGYMLMRERLEAIVETRKKRIIEAEKEREMKRPRSSDKPSRERERSGEREREKGGERGRERDRGIERERERDKGGEREREWVRRDGGRERERDRSSEKERERRRDGERERERDRDARYSNSRDRDPRDGRRGGERERERERGGRRGGPISFRRESPPASPSQ